MKHSVKRVAAIHDLSGFGRASLTAIIPILSSMGVQVCPLPTAILSNHTGGFDTFSFVDFTDHMQDYIDHWKELNIDFDCIYSGFLGSERQIEIVSGFIDDFGTEDNMVVIDPVLGDNGNLYSTMDQGLVEGMKRLVTKADIITPNFTEVSLLLGEEYKQTTTDEEIKEWVKRLSDMGPDIIVVTSVPDKEKDKDSNVIAYDRTCNRSGQEIQLHFPSGPDKAGRKMPARTEFFFFQAGDGIRDTSVTGVQTCALPIFCTLIRK